jgi:hypothetical protein
MERSTRDTVRSRNSDAGVVSDNWILRGANALLRPAGLALVPEWRLRSVPSFTYRGKTFECFFHPYNCGRPPWRMTERAMELAIADTWLSSLDVCTVVEIGAVTPYYWPHRLKEIVDPYDGHALVTSAQSLFSIDLSGRNVLSISTLEHVGLGDYGPASVGDTAVAALDKICLESARMLITAPYGVNPTLDEVLFSSQRFADDVRVTYMIRSKTGNDWRECSVEDAAIPYSAASGAEAGWANSVAVIERDDSI